VSDTAAELVEIGIIPVVRCAFADQAIRVAETLVEAGMRAIEITLTVPDALKAIASLATRHRSGVLIGAGTVVDATMAQRAIDAGAQFVVSPGLVPAVNGVARGAGVTMLSGALTPTEILAALEAGTDLIKIFPAQALGGPSYIKALRGPFPDVPLVPTGGVSLENVAEFFDAGATAVGVGSELVSRELLARSDWDGLGARARDFVAAVRASRK